MSKWEENDPKWWFKVSLQWQIVKNYGTKNSCLVVSNIFLCSSLPGEMIQFDKHIFQMGWFNHQLVGIDHLDQSTVDRWIHTDDLHFFQHPTF